MRLLSVEIARRHTLFSIGAMSVCACTLFALFLLLFHAPVQARHFPSDPVDITAFPDIRLRFPCTNPEQSAAITFTISEDGQARPLRSAPTREQIYPDTQILFLLDLPAGSEEQIRPIGDRLNQLFTHYSATVPSAELIHFSFTALAPLSTGLALDAIEPWTLQLGEVVSKVYRLQLQSPAATGLTALVDDAYSQFDMTANARRTIVLFSDGADPVSADQLQAFLQKAAEQPIRIDTIFINTGPGNRANLETFATTTNGLSIENLTRSEEVDALLARLVAPETLCSLSYRTDQTHPRLVTIQELLTGTPIAITSIPLPAIDVTPPVVTLRSTLPRHSVVLSAGRQTQTLPLEVSWAFTNASHFPTRRLKQITYQVIGANRALSVVTPLLNLEVSPVYLDIPMGGGRIGNFSVQVVVEDEIGLQGRAILPFRIALPTPIATHSVTPSPTPSATPLLPGRINQSIDATIPYSSLNLTLVSALLLLGLLLIILDQLRRRMSKADDPARSPSFSPDSSAVPALLLRIQTAPGLALRQVVKLDHNVELPKALVRDAQPSTYAKNLQKVQQAITTRALIKHDIIQGFQLSYPPGARLAPLHFQRNGVLEELPLNKDETLQHDDLIYLSRKPDILYRFIDLTHTIQPDAGNGVVAPPNVLEQP